MKIDKDDIYKIAKAVVEMIKDKNMIKEDDKWIDIPVSKLKRGDGFKYKGYYWIVLDVSNNTKSPSVFATMDEPINDEGYPFDEKGDNNYKKSSLRKFLNNKILPTLDVNDLVLHSIDLTTDSGDIEYGRLAEEIFILTCDEYRRYRNYLPCSYFLQHTWTCTAWSYKSLVGAKGVKYINTYGELCMDTARQKKAVIPCCLFSGNAIVQYEPRYK